MWSPPIMWSHNINPHVVTPKQTQTTSSRYTVFLDQEFRTTVQNYGTEKDNIKLRFGISLKEICKS